jgi:uncharacterized RDD family membrane protein YckC
MIKALFKIIIGVALIIVAVVFGPLLGIWSLNTLFPVLAISYSLSTWAAFGLLFGSATGLSFGSKKS